MVNVPGGSKSDKEEIPGGRLSMRGYIMTYSRLKKQNICQLWGSQKRGPDFLRSQRLTADRLLVEPERRQRGQLGQSGQQKRQTAKASGQCNSHGAISRKRSDEKLGKPQQKKRDLCKYKSADQKEEPFAERRGVSRKKERRAVCKKEIKKKGGEIY